ncbi:TrbI/VirB10 family protein [Alterisphingorhabdus coralli]|uniref:TrbI/VirB10 family protein n=1 Tax=Alterisphingorhabdus coralli TaxID=3071408 RepID=A0AA97FBI0_9SPHN|nr:TrbI/VirB10 family protein [Parasphingorhabdus sp. SCSIO 66989]WOE76748.1 TrbI/VirB10 family protein [Parasphingorhabdus sp. SCSIO 66989]
MSDTINRDSTENPLPAANGGDGDRKESASAKVGAKVDMKKLALFGAGIFGLVAVGSGAFNSGGGDEEKPDREPVEVTMKESDPVSDRLNTQAIDPVDGAPLEQPGEEVPSLNGEAPVTGVQPQGQGLSDAEKRRQQRLAELEAMRRSPVIVMAGTGGQTGVLTGAARSNASLPGSAGDAQSSQASAGSDFNDNFQGRKINRIRGGLQPNRNFTIEAGSQIPCVLQNAMDSTLSGLVTCVVSSDVRSATGSVIVLDKGTKIIGEYKGGIQDGQSRLFVIWNRAVTPEGVSMKLSSPATDALGRAGLEGDVENFFFKRFGAALLLSIVGDLGFALQNEIAGAQQTFRAPNQVAQQSVNQNISPVLRAPQGAILNVMAAHDLDFSNIYSLRLRPAHAR